VSLKENFLLPWIVRIFEEDLNTTTGDFYYIQTRDNEEKRRKKEREQDTATA